MAASSSSSFGPAKSSQPLHNFELPPQLRWNNREGKSGGSQRRWRSMKPQPQRPNSFSASPRRRDSFTPPPAPRFESPIRDFAADEEMKDEFERLSLLREEALRHHRGRDWWSESGKSSDVIAYRRNPQRKSGFSGSPARFGDDRRSDADADAGRGFDVYHRNNPYKKSSSFSGEVDAYNTGRSAFSFNENKSDAAFRRNPNFRKSGFSSPTKQQQQQQPPFSFSNFSNFSNFSSSSNSNSQERNCRMVEDHHESYSYPRNSNSNYFRKSGFPSPNKHPNFSFKDVASYPRYPYLKKSGFSSPQKQALSSSSSSYTRERDDDANQKNPYFKKSGFSSPAQERKSKVGEADSSYSKIPMKKSASDQAAAAYVSNSLEKNPKAPEADAASPEKKSAVASAETTTKKKKKIGSSNTPKERKMEEKSKAAETIAENPKNLSEEKKDKASDEIKDDSQKGNEEEENIPVDDEEEIKVWNLRPRNVKSKVKANSTCAAAGSKNKARPKLPAAGGEKKEKKKLSVEVSLTKQEIEEDIYALTGGKPSRRPKKRPKNVQKQLDSVFPGLWLLSITPESYKVSENSLKG